MRDGQRMMDGSAMFRCAIWSVMALAACGGPRVALAVEPRDAMMIVDGHLVRSPVDSPVPYHGVMDLGAAPAPPGEPTPRQVSEPKLGGTRRMLATPEPVTPWIFPFDFVVEMAMVPFVEAPVHRAELDLPERDDVPDPGTVDPGLESLVHRADAAAIAR